VASLKRPRKIMIMVKAGWPVDAVIKQLTPFLEPGDLIIDGGNSFFIDTERRSKELEEAAIIDGAGRFRIYWQIILPLSKAALIALSIFVFLATWNDLFWPLIVLNRLEMRTLTVGLTVLQGTYTQERGLVIAGAVVASAPVLLLYAIFQRRIVQGVMLTGMGGR